LTFPPECCRFRQQPFVQHYPALSEKYIPIGLVHASALLQFSQ